MTLPPLKERIPMISIPANGSIRQAMRMIDRGAIGFALLVEPESDRFVGLVTDGDIRRALLEGFGMESPVSHVPRPGSQSASEDDPPEKIAAMFSEFLRVVPLLDSTGKVVDLAVYDPRVRLPVAEPILGEKELQYVSECVLTGWVSSAGKFVSRFEEMFAEFCNARHAIATSSGTTALHLALVAQGIGAGDEVIVPSLTFIATANAVLYTGAQPILVDSEPQTWNLDPEKVEATITDRTKAIIPVHLYGHPADMDALGAIAKQHGLAIIEDSAEAHGALYKGQRVGSLGETGIFSFYGNKIITTGEGGMVLTNKDALAEKLRVLRDHGMDPDRRYWHPVLGYNYRMTNIQAALGVAQMERIESLLSRKKEIAIAYSQGLADIPGIQLPPQMSWAENVYWLYSIIITPDIFGCSRDDLMENLTQANIETRPLFPPIHQQPIYNTGQSLPVAEHLSENGLSLPSAVTLKIEDVERIVQAIKRAPCNL